MKKKHYKQIIEICKNTITRLTVRLERQIAMNEELQDQTQEKDDIIQELNDKISYYEEYGRESVNPYEEIGMRECDF